MHQRIPLPPYPNGWFAISYSSDLAAGEVKSVHYLGRDMVLYRGEGGRAYVVDPYCDHLGAHLGVGGTVVGESIRCPFHSWCYAGDTGRCVSIPYTEKIPAKAAIGVWQVWENNGFIFVWHHTEGDAPTYEIDIAEETNDPEFVVWGTKEWMLPTHPQEVMENGVDIQHFETLHGWKAKAIDWVPEGHRYSLRIEVDTAEAEQAVTAQNATDVDSFNSGPSFTITRVRGAMNGVAVNVLTPVDPEMLHIQHTYYRHKSTSQEIADAFFNGYMADYQLDVPIWSSKVYKPLPTIAENDGPYIRFRRWYGQFYTKPEAGNQPG